MLAYMKRDIRASDCDEIDVPPCVPQVPDPFLAATEVICSQIGVLEILEEAVVCLCRHSPSNCLFLLGVSQPLC